MELHRERYLHLLGPPPPRREAKKSPVRVSPYEPNRPKKMEQDPVKLSYRYENLLDGDHADDEMEGGGVLLKSLLFF